MQKSSDGSNNFDEARSGSPRSKPVVGDADNVQKTSYVTGHGTDPDAPERRGQPRAAASTSKMSPLVWVVLVVVVAVALFFGASLLG